MPPNRIVLVLPRMTILIHLHHLRVRLRRETERKTILRNIETARIVRDKISGTDIPIRKVLTNGSAEELQVQEGTMSAEVRETEITADDNNFLSFIEIKITMVCL